jgi:hypothetical protein
VGDSYHINYCIVYLNHSRCFSIANIVELSEKLSNQFKFLGTNGKAGGEMGWLSKKKQEIYFRKTRQG